MTLMRKWTLAISVLLGVTLVCTAVRPVAAKTDEPQVVLQITHNSYVYDEEGKRLKSFHGNKKPRLTVGVTIAAASTKAEKALGDERKNGPKFYEIGSYDYDDGYIKAANAKLVAAPRQAGLWLNHNSYVYDQEGHRVYYQGKKKLYWGHTVNYTGAIRQASQDSKKYYLLDDDNYHQSYLPYRTIKGKTYYQIGKNHFVRADNVGQIDSRPLYASEAKVTLGHGTKGKVASTSPKYTFKNGEKITIDRVTGMYNGNDFERYYRVKGRPNVFVNESNVISALRQKLKTHTQFTYVALQNTTDLYNVNGQQKAAKHREGEPARTTYAPVSKKVYLWLPGAGKAELFYRLQDLWSDGERGFYSAYLYDNNKDNLNYVKATDVKYLSGPLLVVENTPAGAKADSLIANASAKKELQRLIDEAPVVKAGPDYQNPYFGYKSAYDGALKIAQDVNGSNQSTMAEVKEATWLLQKSQDNLRTRPVLEETLPIY